MSHHLLSLRPRRPAPCGLWSSQGHLNSAATTHSPTWLAFELAGTPWETQLEADLCRHSSSVGWSQLGTEDQAQAHPGFSRSCSWKSGLGVLSGAGVPDLQHRSAPAVWQQQPSRERATSRGLGSLGYCVRRCGCKVRVAVVRATGRWRRKQAGRGLGGGRGAPLGLLVGCRDAGRQGEGLYPVPALSCPGPSPFSFRDCALCRASQKPGARDMGCAGSCGTV